jgi:hypothetical protein
MALSKEELAELAELEKEEQTQFVAEADALARQRLEAKRMRKRLAPKHGKHGLDFAVVELDTGMNIALRRPLDVDIDTLSDEKAEGQERAFLENFVIGLLIEPSKEDVQKCFSDYCGVVTALAEFAKRMTGSARAEDAKK